jgi:hypothetical protein
MVITQLCILILKSTMKICRNDSSRLVCRLGLYADKHHTQTSHYIRVKRTTPPADEFTLQLIYPAAWGWTIAVV